MLALYLILRVLHAKRIKKLVFHKTYRAACWSRTILNKGILLKLKCLCQRQRNVKFWILQAMFFSVRCIYTEGLFPALKRSVWHFFPHCLLIPDTQSLTYLCQCLTKVPQRSWHTNSLVLLGGKSSTTRDVLGQYSLQAEDEEDDGPTLVGCRKLWNHTAQRQQNSAGQENWYVTLNLLH